MILAVALFTLLALLMGLGLGVAANLLRAGEDPVVEQINDCLPQTQCAQCGYPGCRPYAEAIASGAAEINQCPPGGKPVIRALADLLGREPKPLNPHNGIETEPVVAVIDEPACIGCSLCISACPVDAILGASQRMHTVIAAQCTGCELCIPPCPVDCIALVPTAASTGPEKHGVAHFSGSTTPAWTYPMSAP